MLKVGKAIWTLLLIQWGALALLFGGYWGLKSNIVELKTQAGALEQRLAVAEQILQDRAPSPTAQPALAPSMAEPIQQQTQNAEKVTPSNDAAPDQPPAKSLAEAVAETAVCVDKNTHKIFPCENAANCLGPKGFDPTYFNALRTKLGITTPMMICSLKSTQADTQPSSE